MDLVQESVRLEAELGALLLSELTGVEEDRRGARFVCAIAVMRDGRVLFETEGTCEGRILDHERGDGGFGYDPLFRVADGLLDVDRDITFAELPAAEKDKISHRGVALREVARYLGQYHLGQDQTKHLEG